MLWKYWKTDGRGFYKTARLTTAVFAVNSALGATAGALAEFGLVQVGQVQTSTSPALPPQPLSTPSTEDTSQKYL